MSSKNLFEKKSFNSRFDFFKSFFYTFFSPSETDFYGAKDFSFILKDLDVEIENFKKNKISELFNQKFPITFSSLLTKKNKNLPAVSELEKFVYISMLCDITKSGVFHEQISSQEQKDLIFDLKNNVFSKIPKDYSEHNLTNVADSNFSLFDSDNTVYLDDYPEFIQWKLDSPFFVTDSTLKYYGYVFFAHQFIFEYFNDLMVSLHDKNFSEEDFSKKHILMQGKWSLFYERYIEQTIIEQVKDVPQKGIFVFAPLVRIYLNNYLELFSDLILETMRGKADKDELIKFVNSEQERIFDAFLTILALPTLWVTSKAKSNQAIFFPKDLEHYLQNNILSDIFGIVSRLVLDRSPINDAYLTAGFNKFATHLALKEDVKALIQENLPLVLPSQAKKVSEIDPSREKLNLPLSDNEELKLTTYRTCLVNKKYYSLSDQEWKAFHALYDSLQFILTPPISSKEKAARHDSEVFLEKQNALHFLNLKYPEFEDLSNYFFVERANVTPTTSREPCIVIGDTDLLEEYFNDLKFLLDFDNVLLKWKNTYLDKKVTLQGLFQEGVLDYSNNLKTSSFQNLILFVNLSQFNNSYFISDAKSKFSLSTEEVEDLRFKTIDFSTSQFSITVDCGNIFKVLFFADKSEIHADLLKQFKVIELRKLTLEELKFRFSHEFFKQLENYSLPLKIWENFTLRDEQFRLLSKLPRPIRISLIQDFLSTISSEHFSFPMKTGEFYENFYKENNECFNKFLNSSSSKQFAELINEYFNLGKDLFNQLLNEAIVKNIAQHEFFEILYPNLIPHSLDNIKGNKEVIEQINLAIETFLYPKKAKELGLSQPKGFLLDGETGTGKTMLAQALAKKLNVPFISTTASALEDKYVGESAKRVKQLFKIARQNSPCVIFIDEFDSIGNREKTSNGGTTSLVNAFLSEMDGTYNNQDILFIATTNDKSRIDKAILRPGRLDRIFTLELPTASERREVIEEIAKSYKIETNQDKKPVDFTIICDRTTGKSPAYIKGLFQQAGFFALRNKSKVINQEHINAAFLDLELGTAKPKEIDQHKLLTAVHEVGHAFVNLMLKGQRFDNVSVMPRSNSLGVSFSSFNENTTFSEEFYLGRLSVIAGGKMAEEVFYNTTTSGVSSDLRQIQRTIHSMIYDYGMFSNFKSDEVDINALRYMNLNSNSNLSESIKQLLDKIQIYLLSTQTHLTKYLIVKNTDCFLDITQMLFEKEFLSFEDILPILEKYKLSPYQVDALCEIEKLMISNEDILLTRDKFQKRFKEII